MNERMIQNALRIYRQQHQVIVPNINMLWGESDLLTVTRAGFVLDHEIKISKADFKADGGRKGKEITSIWKYNKHRAMELGLTQSEQLPNYFFYVAPAHLLTPNDVPIYAGLLHWHPTTDPRYPFGYLTIAKQAPRLHDRKITPGVMQQLARALMFRYWNARQANDPTCPGVEVAA